MKTLIGILSLTTGLALSASADKPASAQPDQPPKPAAASNFRFSGGDAERGKQAFGGLQCIQCHRVTGAALPDPERRRLDLEIGKEPRFVKRYEDLITAVTNPKHVVTEQYLGILSKAEAQGEIEPFMPKLTEHMTARQLIDIVTFLHNAFSAHNPEYAGGD